MYKSSTVTLDAVCVAMGYYVNNMLIITLLVVFVDVSISEYRHTRYDFFFIGFNVPFNTFQVTSGRCLLVTEGMITTL